MNDDAVRAKLKELGFSKVYDPFVSEEIYERRHPSSPTHLVLVYSSVGLHSWWVRVVALQLLPTAHWQKHKRFETRVVKALAAAPREELEQVVLEATAAIDEELKGQTK